MLLFRTRKHTPWFQLSERYVLTLSSSEELDVISTKAGEFEDLPSLSPAYEELVEVVTQAVAKFNTDWQEEKQEVCRKSKLAHSKSQPPHWGLPFFPDIHTDMSLAHLCQTTLRLWG